MQYYIIVDGAPLIATLDNRGCIENLMFQYNQQPCNEIYRSLYARIQYAIDLDLTKVETDEL